MLTKFLSASVLVFVANLAQAVTIQPGETISVRCSQDGGGGSNPTCTEELSTYCNSNTSYNRDQCYNLAANYCPSTNYSSCVAKTSSYCNRNTSMTRDQCFQSSLKTCNGRDDRDGVAIHSLMEQVRLGAHFTAKGGNLLQLKGEMAPKE
jgi:hypothetical protein